MGILAISTKILAGLRTSCILSSSRAFFVPTFTSVTSQCFAVAEVSNPNSAFFSSIPMARAASRTRPYDENAPSNTGFHAHRNLDGDGDFQPRHDRHLLDVDGHRERLEHGHAHGHRSSTRAHRSHHD